MAQGGGFEGGDGFQGMGMGDQSMGEGHGSGFWDFESVDEVW